MLPWSPDLEAVWQWLWRVDTLKAHSPKPIWHFIQMCHGSPRRQPRGRRKSQESELVLLQGDDKTEHAGKQRSKGRAETETQKTQTRSWSWSKHSVHWRREWGNGKRQQVSGEWWRLKWQPISNNWCDLRFGKKYRSTTGLSGNSIRIQLPIFRTDRGGGLPRMYWGCGGLVLD